MKSRVSLLAGLVVMCVGTLAQAKVIDAPRSVAPVRTDRWFLDAHIGFSGLFDGAWGHFSSEPVQATAGGSFGRDILEWPSARMRLGVEGDYSYTSLSASIAGSMRRVDLHAPRAGVVLRWIAHPSFELRVRALAGVLFADTSIRSSTAVPALQGLSYAFTSELTAGLSWVPRLTGPRAPRAVYFALSVDGGVVLGTPIALRVSPNAINGADLIAGEGTSLGSAHTFGALGRVSVGLRF